jgi:hypothetical protein
LFLHQLDLRPELAGGEVALGQHDHPAPQHTEQVTGIGGLPDPVGAQRRVDDRAGAAGHQGQNPGQGIAGVPLVTTAAVVDRQVGRGVGVEGFVRGARNYCFMDPASGDPRVVIGWISDMERMRRRWYK